MAFMEEWRKFISIVTKSILNQKSLKFDFELISIVGDMLVFDWLFELPQEKFFFGNGAKGSNNVSTTSRTMMSIAIEVTVNTITMIMSNWILTTTSIRGCSTMTSNRKY